MRAVAKVGKKPRSASRADRAVLLSGTSMMTGSGAGRRLPLRPGQGQGGVGRDDRADLCARATGADRGIAFGAEAEVNCQGPARGRVGSPRRNEARAIDPRRRAVKPQQRRAVRLRHRTDLRMGAGVKAGLRTGGRPGHREARPA